MSLLDAQETARALAERIRMVARPGVPVSYVDVAAFDAEAIEILVEHTDEHLVDIIHRGAAKLRKAARK